MNYWPNYSGSPVTVESISASSDLKEIQDNSSDQQLKNKPELDVPHDNSCYQRLKNLPEVLQDDFIYSKNIQSTFVIPVSISSSPVSLSLSLSLVSLA